MDLRADMRGTSEENEKSEMRQQTEPPFCPPAKAGGERSYGWREMWRSERMEVRRPEVVRVPDAGILVERNAEDLAHGIRTLLGNPPDRAATRAYAEGFSWQSTTDGQIAVFNRILAAQPR